MGEPLSWLLLERHALGELPEAEEARVRAHLGSCAACAACAAEASRPIPLAFSDQVPALRADPRSSRWRRYAGAWATTAALAGAAAGFLLLARAPEHSDRLNTAPLAAGETLPGVKGGDVALELVRERDGTIIHGAGTFVPDDRWKALVTCPAGGVVFWDVAVRETDREDARFPLSPAGPLACGNHVVLPGAFRLSGKGPAEVCVSLAADPLPRSAKNPFAGGHKVCVSLRPER